METERRGFHRTKDRTFNDHTNTACTALKLQPLQHIRLVIFKRCSYVAAVNDLIWTFDGGRCRQYNYTLWIEQFYVPLCDCPEPTVTYVTVTEAKTRLTRREILGVQSHQIYCSIPVTPPGAVRTDHHCHRLGVYFVNLLHFIKLFDTGACITRWKSDDLYTVVDIYTYSLQ